MSPASPSNRRFSLVRRELAPAAKLFLVPPVWVAATAWTTPAEARASALATSVPFFAFVFVGASVILLSKELLSAPTRESPEEAPPTKREQNRAKLVAFAALLLFALVVVGGAWLVFRRGAPRVPASAPSSIGAPESGPPVRAARPQTHSEEIRS